jgi:hypothetical protein
MTATATKAVAHSESHYPGNPCNPRCTGWAKAKDVKEFADELANAYSTDNYGGNWSGCIRMLRKRGYDDQSIEAIIRSKHTRWAGDGSNKGYGKVTSVDLAKYLDDPRNRITPKEVAQLVRETFNQ